MSRGGDTRFTKGTSCNPAGRPKKRRPHVSAFDIVFDKTLNVTQGGRTRELTIEEALELQTYQAALKGSKMAVRKVLRMIEKREGALAKKAPSRTGPIKVELHHSSDNANKALRILGIAGDDGHRMKVHAWATPPSAAPAAASSPRNTSRISSSSPSMPRRFAGRGGGWRERRD